MLAAAVVIGCFPGSGMEIMDIIRPKPAPEAVTGEVICIEIFLTGILIFMVFAFAANSYKAQKDAKRVRETGLPTGIPDRTAYIPIVIGFTLGFLGLLGGSTSGGAFNPAIVWAPVLFSGVWGDSWKYWVG